MDTDQNSLRRTERVALVIGDDDRRQAITARLQDRAIPVLAAASAGDAQEHWSDDIRVLVVDASAPGDAADLVRTAHAAQVRFVAAAAEDTTSRALELLDEFPGGFISLDREPDSFVDRLIWHVDDDARVRALTESMATAKAELENAFDTFPAPLFIMGPDLNIRRMNRAALALTGRDSYKDVVALPCCDAMSCGVGDACAIRTLLTRGLRNLDVDDLNTQWTHQPSGRLYRPRVISMGRGEDPNTTTDSVLVLVEDATFVNDYESESARAQKLNAVGLLAATLSHEINQPLGAIMGRAQLAILETERLSGETDGLQRDLEEIIENVNRVSRILDKLHTVTDIVTKPYVGETEILDLEKSSGEGTT